MREMQLQQKVCQTDMVFLSGRFFLKNFDREKVTK